MCARRCGCCRAKFNPDDYHEVEDFGSSGITRLVPKITRNGDICDGSGSAPFYGILEFKFVSLNDSASSKEVELFMKAVSDQQHLKGLALENGRFIFVIDRSDENVDIVVEKDGNQVGGAVIEAAKFKALASETQWHNEGSKWNKHTETLLMGTSGATSTITIEFRYTFVRGTKDEGNQYGAGYYATAGGCCEGQGTANHWCCSHDNVYVVPAEVDGNEPRFKPGTSMGLALEKVERQSEKMKSAFDALAADENSDEHMQLLANTTKKWVGHIHHEISKVKLEMMAERRMRDRSFMGEGGRGMNATINIFLNYGNLFKSNANKQITLSVAASNHWQTEQNYVNELIDRTSSEDATALSPRKLAESASNAIEEAGNDNSYFGLFRDLQSDQDGRIFKTLDRGHTAPGTLAGIKPELYNVRVAVPTDNSSGMGNLFVLKPGTPCVVFDCDGTLTTGDEEVVKQFFLSTVGMDDLYDPLMQPGASTCCRLWASKGYQCVYLSGRQGAFQQLSNNWLMSHDFPPGPVHLTRTSAPTLPIYSSVGVFKVDYIDELKAKGCEIYACYGNTATDIKAYENIGCPKERTYIVGPHGGEDGSQAIDYVTHNPSILTDHPNATVSIPYTSMSWGPVFVGEDDTSDEKNHSQHRHQTGKKNLA